MKKTYIAPALSLHKLNIESSLLGPSRFTRVDVGNFREPDAEKVLNPSEGPDKSWTIDLIEGDEWETL